MNEQILLKVDHLRIAFVTGGRQCVPVRDVTFEVPVNGRVALVGESGCGKSLTSLAIGGLVDHAVVSGTITGSPRLGYVFQNPMQSLDPVMRVGRQIIEGTAHRDARPYLESVGLPPSFVDRYPCQLSGGQQQRVMIAMALALEPELLIADEPTTALDVTTQQEVLDLIAKVADAHRMAVLLITHNLGLVSRYAQYVNVMYAGEIVERGLVREVLAAPLHPYTRGLLAAVPRLEASKDACLTDIPGTVPPPDAWPSGCAFHPRCAFRQPECQNGSHNIPCLENYRHAASCTATA